VALVVDDLATWPVALLADAGPKRLTSPYSRSYQPTAGGLASSHDRPPRAGHVRHQS